MANSLADTNDVLHSPNLHPVGTRALDAVPLPEVDACNSTAKIGIKNKA
jgi:hypothetical protein